MQVQISKIKITDRIRKEITKIAELSEDIRANGLINPITVMSLADDEYQLLAGLRRLRATEMLGCEEIAVHVVAPADAEAQLRIEVSENEYREPFTFSEKMDFARLLEDIEREKAKGRKWAGIKIDDDDLPPQGAEGRKGETREIVAEKIGMGKTTYDRAKYVAENAPEDVIDELDQGKRSIRGTYDEIKAKEKAEKSTSPADHDEDDSKDTVMDEPEVDMESEPPAPNPDVVKKPKDKAQPSASSYPMGLLSKAEEEAVERNKKFNAMSDAEKVTELQRLLKEEKTRAATAESELARLKEHHQNLIYHKDGAIANLQARLDAAETKVEELKALYGIPAGE